ncbi:hypothetical protein AB0D67_27610 [Streptosporangium sp. NPDC048047]|uniref:hypothetical protein n=1 Tax=Streptosporangium sp. NPDC048047 TaxID=3155748 RepID=UPI00342FACD4
MAGRASVIGVRNGVYGDAATTTEVEMSGKISKTVVRLGFSIVIALAGVTVTGMAANASDTPVPPPPTTHRPLCCNPWG